MADKKNFDINAIRTKVKNNKNKNDEYSGYDRAGIGINRL